MAERIGGQRPAHHHLDPQDVEAVLEARRDLGPAYEPALVESLTDKIETAIQARVDAQLEESRRHQADHGQRHQRQMVLGIVSLGTGIPITAIAGALGDGLPGVLVAWAGIAAVNAAHAWSGRNRR